MLHRGLVGLGWRHLLSQATPGDYWLTCQAHIPDYLAKNFRKPDTEKPFSALRKLYANTVPDCKTVKNISVVMLNILKTGLIIRYFCIKSFTQS